MSNAGYGQCTYCQKENVVIVSTPEIELYCKECHQLVIDNCYFAIQEIEEIEKSLENE